MPLITALMFSCWTAAAPPTTSHEAARVQAMRAAQLRVAAARGAVSAMPRPRKAKARTLPGRISATKGAKSKVRVRPPKRVRKPPGRTSAPCSTIEAGVHDGSVRPGLEGLVADKYWVWPTGSTLHVHFLDGSPEARAAVAKIAVEWTVFANLDFVFHLEDAAPSQVDIAITFDDPACNSSMGPSSRTAAAWGGASMRLCHIDNQVGSDFFRRAVLHEFGHALGMHHEHQSPAAGFSWDKPAVYAHYAQIGWDEAFVDQWVFARVSQDQVRTTQWDPDSVMHYEFPASFTTDRIAIHGGNVLSALDKSFVAEIYPGRGVTPKKPKPRPVGKIKHFTQRRVVLRNDTAIALLMEVVVERRFANGWRWTPAADPERGETFTVAPGAERTLPATLAGRAARVRARSEDGTQIWSDHAEPLVVLADAAGYDDKAVQSVVIATSGEPDAPATLGRDALWDRALVEFDAASWASACEAFADFVARNPDDPWVPWAKVYIVMGLLEQAQPTEAAYAAYQLIVDFPESDASGYAWFYGGVAAMQRGACEDAKAYFAVVSSGDAALPSEWVKAARAHVDEIEGSAATWCG